MQSKKTHAQHLRIVEKQEETGNAGADFDAKGDLARNPSAQTAHAEGSDLRTDTKDLTTDRGMIRGVNQASPHHKRSGN